MGTITMTFDIWWKILICFGTIATGVVYIIFSISVIDNQLKSKLSPVENEGKEENKAENKAEPPNQA